MGHSLSGGIRTFSAARILVIFSDVHIGAVEHAERQFDELLRWILDNDAYAVANGDLCEFSVPSGKAMGDKLMGQNKWPTEQVKIAFDKLKPLAKKGKLVGLTRGNHDAGRPRNTALFDACEMLAHALDVPYLGVGGYLRFNTGKQSYVVAVQHGRSGAKNPFLENDRMMHLYPLAELVALGHNHHLGARTVESIGIDKNGVECLREVWQVRTGSYLQYADYAREMVLPPTRIGSPIIRFDNREHGVEVDCKTLSWSVL